MQIFHEKLTAAQVCAATGVAPATLQTWIKRDALTGGDHHVEKRGTGPKRAFSFFHAIEVAAAKALTDAGASVPDAFAAACRFAHVGDEGRWAGFPFPGGAATVILLAGGHHAVVAAEPGADLLALARQHLDGAPAFIALDASAVFERALAVLGYSAADVIAEAGTPPLPAGFVDDAL